MSDLSVMRGLLEQPEIRLEFSKILSLSRGQIESAQVYVRMPAVRQGGRDTWKAFNPLLLAPSDGGSRADLLRMIADILESED